MSEVTIVMSAVMAALAVLSTAVGALNWFVIQRVSLAIAEMRSEHAEQRSEDKEEMKEWINGSFMRASTVEANLDKIQQHFSLLPCRLPGCPGCSK